MWWDDEPGEQGAVVRDWRGTGAVVDWSDIEGPAPEIPPAEADGAEPGDWPRPRLVVLPTTAADEAHEPEVASMPAAGASGAPRPVLTASEAPPREPPDPVAGLRLMARELRQSLERRR